MKKLTVIFSLMFLLSSCNNQKEIANIGTVQYLNSTQTTDVFVETTGVDMIDINTTAFSFSEGIETNEQITQIIETTSDTTTSVATEYVTSDQTTQRKSETVSPAVTIKTQVITTYESLSSMTTSIENTTVSKTHPQKETTPPSQLKAEETTGPADTTVSIPKSPYDMPIDIEAIKNELIILGENMGMKHKTVYKDGTTVTPDNSSWEMPITVSASFFGDALKIGLYDYVSSYAEYELYGGEPITDFTIYVESIEGGYLIYFLH